MSELYEKLYGNPPIAEFIINTERLFEVLRPKDEEVDDPYLSKISGVLLYDGKLKILKFINCNNFSVRVVPVFEPITKNVVAFASKMFNQVFRLPQNRYVKVIIRKDVIEFRLPNNNSFSLIDVLGYVILK